MDFRHCNMSEVCSIILEYLKRSQEIQSNMYLNYHLKDRKTDGNLTTQHPKSSHFPVIKTIVLSFSLDSENHMLINFV